MTGMASPVSVEQSKTRVSPTCEMSKLEEVEIFAGSDDRKSVLNGLEIIDIEFVDSRVITSVKRLWLYSGTPYFERVELRCLYSMEMAYIVAGIVRVLITSAKFKCQELGERSREEWRDVCPILETFERFEFKNKGP